VAVLRDGKYAGSVEIKDIDNDKLIAMMVGRTIEDQFPYRDGKKGDLALEVKNLSCKEGVKGASFTLRKGEI
ncbi:D-xylose ABC transporter ATP-binding protein, partial [Enterococcus faecalis]|nr:D-xylose ABC transporter ATP-binding protein [Enterococcus faecalis]